MPRPFRTVPIQYHIKTTSDWTTFQIVEGGFWSNIKVEYLKGKDTLYQDILHSKKRIEIHKPPYRKELVEVMVTCNLNIYEDYLLSQIHYLIKKGAIESTIVRILRKGKEIFRLPNYETGSQENPKHFYVQVVKHSLPIPLTDRLLTFFKFMGLVALGYVVMLVLSFVYCYGFALDFAEFARSNPSVLILGGAALSAVLIDVGVRKNWV